jgi:ribosomal protein L11 methylase PrmA
MINPRMAVMRKLVEVLRMETRVEEVLWARALVKRVHIMKLKRRFRVKKSWRVVSLVGKGRGEGDLHRGL